VGDETTPERPAPRPTRPRLPSTAEVRRAGTPRTSGRASARTPGATASLRTRAGRYAPARRVISFAILGRAAAIWGRNLLPFTLISIVCHAPWIAGLVLTSPTGVRHEDVALLPTLIALTGPAFSLLAAGAVSYGVMASLRGQRPAIGDCLVRGFRRFPTILGTSLTLLMYVILAGLVLGLPAGLVATVILRISPSAVGIFLATVVQLLPVALVMALFWVSVPAAVIEGVGTRIALRRSKELTRGNLGAAFLVNVALLAATSAVTLVSRELAERGAAPMRIGMHELPLPTFDLTLILAVTVAARVLVFGPLAAVASAVAYHDLRVAQDGVSADELVRVFE
jgi:hypothetical protein